MTYAYYVSYCSLQPDGKVPDYSYVFNHVDIVLEYHIPDPTQLSPSVPKGAARLVRAKVSPLRLVIVCL